MDQEDACFTSSASDAVLTLRQSGRPSLGPELILSPEPSDLEHAISKAQSGIAVSPSPSPGRLEGRKERSRHVGAALEAWVLVLGSSGSGHMVFQYGIRCISIRYMDK